MAFKYINPGYPELFDGFKDARALRGGNSKTMNPENGVYIDLMSAAGIVKIPSLSSIYIKFDTYYKKSESRYKVLRVYSGDDVIVGLQHMNSGQDGFSYSINSEIDESNGDNSAGFPKALATGILHTVLVYVSLAAGKTILSVTVDGIEQINTQSSGKYEKITAVTFVGANKLDAGYDGLANIIISDTDCSNEHVAISKLNVDNSGGVTVNIDKLKESMLENADFFDITALQVGQTSIDLDTGHTAAEIVDGLTVETKPPTDRGGVMFTSLVQDPISKQNWDLETLKARTFAVKAAKT
nr:MAG TPA: hypothetical protein [Caudoviricetes sp.]